jgi:hypothetical protein
MALRRGILERLVGRVRGDQPAPLASSAAEQVIAAHLAEGSAAMRTGNFQAWLTRPEPIPRGLSVIAEPALQIACLRVAMERLGAVSRRLTSRPAAAAAVHSIRRTGGYSGDEAEAYLLWLAISHLVYRKLPYNPEDVIYLLDRAAEIVSTLPVRQSVPLRGFEFHSLRELLTGIVKWAGAHGVGADVRAAAERLRDAVMGTAVDDRLPKAERGKLYVLLVDLLDGGGPEGVLNDRDEWGGLMRETLTRMEPGERAAWRPLF